jgi:hypothetical protein
MLVDDLKTQLILALLSAITGGGGVAVWARQKNGNGNGSTERLHQVHRWLQEMREGNIVREAIRAEKDRARDEQDKRLMTAVERLADAMTKLTNEVTEQRRDIREALHGRS